MIPWPSLKVIGNLRTVVVNCTLGLVFELRILIHWTYIQNEAISTDSIGLCMAKCVQTVLPKNCSPEFQWVKY